MSYTSIAEVAASPGFRLISYGRGAAYCLENNTNDGQSFFQGDDATQFREEWEALEKTQPNASQEEVLSTLWNYYN